MILETERLLLRSWEGSDAESLYALAKDPQVGPIAGWPVHTDVENSRDIIRTVLSADLTYAVVLKAEDRAIGSIGLIPNGHSDLTGGEDEAELGYWVGVPYWGQGLIPEASKVLIEYAFEELGMNRLWCGYYEGNEKSRRVQEKLGFRYHHTEEQVPCPLMNEERTLHASCMEKEQWMGR